MNIKPAKKLLILNILDILQKYSDENHRLCQKEIADILKSKYYMEVNRKAVHRNLMDLIDQDYPIEYTETQRKIKNAKTGEWEESYILSDFYLEHRFTDGELRLLIDSLLFSKKISYHQCRELVEKLEGLSSIYFHSRSGHISYPSRERQENHQLFLNIELLDEAIGKGCKVLFHYAEYGIDKQIHLKSNIDGSPKEYCISPYQMVANEGKYYLICNYQKYDDISNYRVDRIRDIQFLDEPVKPFCSLTGADGKPLNLEEYMREHVYMYTSESATVTYDIPLAMVTDVIDLFGRDVRFFGAREARVYVTVRANRQAAVQFARAYAPDVILTEPKHLAQALQTDFIKTAEKYQELQGNTQDCVK